MTLYPEMSIRFCSAIRCPDLIDGMREHGRRRWRGCGLADGKRPGEMKPSDCPRIDQIAAVRTR